MPPNGYIGKAGSAPATNPEEDAGYRTQVRQGTP
jgi:hypothetical protein